MTLKFNNVYLNEVSTVVGPYEKRGPLSQYFDKTYDDFYFKQKTWEQAESKSIIDSTEILLRKINKTKQEIDVQIGGDLLNQLTSINYASSNIGIPLLGVYSACASSVEAMIIASSLVDSNKIKNAITSVSSHNMTAEKQFRYPTEYGGPKPKTTTFTNTGSSSFYISKEKKGVKIDCATIGKVVDMGQTDVYHMGAVMAPSASDTIYKHLIETNRSVDYYDLILTGDLGIYGKGILKELLKKDYNLDLVNYEDAGTLIYDYENQNVYAGGSGPVCLPLVFGGKIFKQMLKKDIKKVLLVATGALHSPTMVNQKLSIPTISHAISLEVIE